MRRFAALLLTSPLLLFSCAGQPLEDDLRLIAESGYGAGTGDWHAFSQPFWPRHRVYRVACEIDPRAVHRPSIAVGHDGELYLLSQGVWRVPASYILDHFNRAAAEAELQLNGDNVAAYAEFVAAVHLASKCGERVTKTDVHENGRTYQAAVTLNDSQGRDSTATLLIEKDGTVREPSSN